MVRFEHKLNSIFREHKVLMFHRSIIIDLRLFSTVYCLTALTTMFILSGCTKLSKPGVADTPPLPKFSPGIFTDVNPRWSHDGRRIAFLRRTPDRRMQLFISDDELDRPLAVLESELVSPDRAYGSSRQRYNSPDTIAWSPDDRRIAFERTEWFTFEDGQRFPGTGIWTLDRITGRVQPMALHPKHYESYYFYYHSPEWSPDGRYVSFSAEGINGQHQLGLISVGAQNTKEVLPRFDNYEACDWPVWKQASSSETNGEAGQKSGNVLAYRMGIQHTQSVARTETIRLIRPGVAGAELSGEIWRINPKSYAVSLGVGNDGFRKPVSYEEGSYRIASQDIVPRAAHLKWSPDGKHIAFTVTPDASDFNRYEIWVLTIVNGIAKRVTPVDSHGYFAPVWIGSSQLGLLSPDKASKDSGVEVLKLDLKSENIRKLGHIASADCDWSPERDWIIYSMPPFDLPNSAEDLTTLRLFKTGLKAQN